jgi:hypothetical protein
MKFKRLTATPVPWLVFVASSASAQTPPACFPAGTCEVEQP